MESQIGRSHTLENPFGTAAPWTAEVAEGNVIIRNPNDVYLGRLMLSSGATGVEVVSVAGPLARDYEDSIVESVLKQVDIAVNQPIR